MSSLRLATASNVRAFQNLTTALSTSDRKWSHAIEKEALEDEIGRFRVWAGNLGALQKGHSSLDYRLRDSPVSSNNTLKLLQELETNVNEAHAVVSGARLPYEEQTPPDLTEDDNDDGFFSADSDDENSSNSSSDAPKTELSMRFREIVDIIDNLYKLSVRIRTPGLRSRSLKASSYTQKDPETGIDIFDVYAEQDLKHVKELVAFLRQPYVGDGVQEEQEFLIKRLSAAVTLRRRHFKYWKRHRDKLSAAEVADEVQEVNAAAPLDGPTPVRGDGAEQSPAVPVVTTLKEAPSQKTGKTLLSGTEATQLPQPLDDIVDNKSVTSYAVTVRDIHGKSIELPPPPKTANGDKDFECPYCWVVCPARYSKGRPWRTHLLQDLQPYCCTYLDCESSHILFRSRREWAEHEASHRKVWRCPEHSDAVFSTQSGLENHLRQIHLDSFPESQLETIAKVGEATAIDMRAKCPICCAPADTEELDDLPSHIANHLERIATFALPHSSEDDSDGASGIASPGSASSRSLLGSVSAGMADEQNENQDSTLQPEQTEPIGVAGSGGDVLSTENLQQLPDTSRNALDIISEQLNSPDSSYHQELAQISNAPPPLEIEDIPTLSSLYSSRRLLQTDQSYAPNDVYNRMVSFCSHDLTKLKVDAIVNNAPLTLSQPPSPGTLHGIVVKAGGSLLLQDVRSRGRLNPGNVIWTRGYDLPSSFVIHAAAPTFVGVDGLIKFKLLGDCYSNALDMAAELGVKTIAFPCLGTGGGIFPPRQAARTALQAVRDYLDARPENGLERIVFCTMVAEDRQAYTDFFPAFFPPTHSDLDRARGSTLSSGYARLVAQILDTLVQVQKAIMLLTSGLIEDAPEAQQDVNVLRRIGATLDLMHNQSYGSEALEANQKNLHLLFSVLSDLCERIIEMAEISKQRTGRTYQELRSNADHDMRATHGFHLRRCLTYCWSFAIGLNEILTSGKTGMDMTETRLNLEGYMSEAKWQNFQRYRHRVSSDGPVDQRHVLSTPFFHDSAVISAYNQDSRDQQHHSIFVIFISDLDPAVTESSLFQLFKDKYPSTESAKIRSDPITGMSPGSGFVYFTSEEDQQKALTEMQGVYCGSRPMIIGPARLKDEVYRLDDETLPQGSKSPVSHRQDLVKLHEIPSVTRFYQLGAIEAQSTLAPPSASFNDTVCLIKEDITKLEVDVIVNITDKSFLGMGTLDRTIFRKGGPELQSELEKLGERKMGDVVKTAGYLLPAKNILHVIPPGVFRSDTKTVLRNIYREILLKATYLNAKSVAIPCIGMGPPRDCAALAMEEVRRFLQSKEPGGLEKIIFTVYSSNNESIYRRLLPVYFPPPEGAPANRSEGPFSNRVETLPSKLTSGPDNSQSSLPEQTSQSMSEEEPLVTVTARVFVSDLGQATPQPICEDLCIVSIFRGSVTFSRDSEHLASATLMSFGIKPDTTWSYASGFYDLIFPEVQRDSAPPGDKARVYIRFSRISDEDEDAFCQILGRVITQTAQDQEEKDKEKDGSDTEDDELRTKPPLLRKKSGELVKPAFRPPARRSPSSMPDTTTYSKAVHFDEDIEQVRHFLQQEEEEEEKEGEEEQRESTVHSSSAKGKEKATSISAPEATTSDSIPDSELIQDNERIMSPSNVTDDQEHADSQRKPPSVSDPLPDDMVTPPPAEPANSAKKTKASACINCWEAYLPCDFQHPCGHCVASGKQGTCIYRKRERPRIRSDWEFDRIEYIRQEAERREGDVGSSPAVELTRPDPDTNSKDDENRFSSRAEPESSTSALNPSSSSGVFDSRASLLSTVEPSNPRISQDSDRDDLLFKPIRSSDISEFQDSDENEERETDRKPGEVDRQEETRGTFSELSKRFRRLLAGSKKGRPSAAGAAAGVASASAGARISDTHSDPKNERNQQNFRDDWEDPSSVTRPVRFSGIFSDPDKKGKEEGAAGRQRDVIGSLASDAGNSDSNPRFDDNPASPRNAFGSRDSARKRPGLDREPLTSLYENQAKDQEIPRGRRQQTKEQPAQPPAAEERAKEEGTLDTLDIEIIAHLTADLRLRPTSYIGQNINDMAAALYTDTATLLAHLESLEKKGRVHRTVDRETWVIDGWKGEMKPVVSSSSGGEGNWKDEDVTRWRGFWR